MTRNYSGEFIGITDVYALQAWCRSVSKGHMTVEFRDDAVTAMVFKRHIIFPRPNARMTKRDAIKMRGLMLHETSHPIYQPDYDRVVVEKDVDMRLPLGMVWNVLLDVHAESCRAREWPGDSKALSEFGTVIGMDLTDRLVPSLTSPETLAKGLDKDFKNCSIAMLAAATVESTWNVGMRLAFAPVYAAFGTEITDAAADVVARFNLNSRLLDQSETAESLLALAGEIYEYLWKPEPQDQGDSEEKTKGKGEPGEKGEESEGEPDEGDSEGDESDEDANESGNDKGDDGEGDSQPPDADDGDEGDSSGKSEGEGDEGEQDQGEEGHASGTFKIESLLFTDHYKRDMWALRT